MSTTPTISNNLKHSITMPFEKGITIKINISLADDCKNGHADFHITGDIFKTAGSRTRFIACGCVHNEILSVRCDLKMFVDLHGSDYKGAPTYAVANGFYFLKTDTKEATVNYLRLIGNEYDTLLQAENEAHFKYLLYNLNIPQRWQNEANIAMKVLESLTGCEYKDTSTRSQLEDITPDEIKSVEDKIKSGYYSSIEIKARKTQKAIDAKNKVISDLVATKEKSILKANTEFNIDMAIINAGFTLENFIYYNHSNEGVFNWKDYGKQVTKEQFDRFMANVDLSNLPKDITFKLK